MRKVFARKAPVQHEGREISLPYTGPGSAGLGQAADVDPAHEPGHPDLARHRAESTVKLTAEVADGWLPLGFPPRA